MVISDEYGIGLINLYRYFAQMRQYGIHVLWHERDTALNTRSILGQ